MKLLTVYQTCFSVLLMFNDAFATHFMKLKRYTNSTGRLSTDHEATTDISLLSCSIKCHANSNCLSVNYKAVVKTCEINVKIGKLDSRDFQTVTDWTIYNVVKGRCMNGWILFLESCYLFETTNPLIWTMAVQKCASLHTHLVSIESAEENNFIKAKLEELNVSSGEQTWTAGNDLNTENVWNWAIVGSDGSVFTNVSMIDFQDWADDEPNQYAGEEDCVTLNSRLAYKWNDVPCDYSFSYICEHKR